jgi:hypothetical protein
VIGTYGNLQDDLCGSRFGCWTHRMRALSTIKVDTHGHIIGGDPAAIAGLETAAAMLTPPPQHPRANCGWNPSSWLGCAKNFAADHPNIAGVIAGVTTFVGCAALTGVESGGLSLAACGAAAGAVGSMVTHWGQCSSGSSANCSVGSYLEAGAIGGVAALATAGVAGAVGGLVGDAAETVFGSGLTSNIVGGAVTGGLSGAAGGALGGGLNYAADCGSSAEGCSWSGLGHAAAGGAVAGAVGGAIVGGVLPLAGSSIARLNPELDQNSAAGQLACDAIGAAAGAVAPHSFTGATPVLMADGTTKPIDRVKVGDQIANSVPGQSGTQTNTVTNVIVTKTDHDFVNLAIEPLSSGTKPTTTATSAQSPGTSVLKKAAIGFAATLTAITSSTATAQATDVTSNGRATVTVPSDVTQHGGTLTTTFHHPFYDITQAAFVDAQNLKAGDDLQTPTGDAIVTSVRLYHANTVTYDLTIGNLHTYYVVAGDTPVLVHNCGTGAARFSVDSSGTATDLQAEFPDPYAGVRQASQVLQDAGVPRNFRVQVLQSFEPGTISVRQAGDADFGIRSYDNVNAWARGRYLTDSWPATREELAVQARWNQFTYLKQWQIRPGATIIEGRVGPQGLGYPGGGTQTYVLDPNSDLLEPGP